MSLGYCSECGGLSSIDIGGLCPACHKQEMGEADRVFDYLRRCHGSVSVDQIAAVTGVRRPTVMKMLKRGWFLEEFSVTYPCEQCGSLIVDGQLCPYCICDIRQEMKRIGWWTMGKKDADSGRFTQTGLKKQNKGFYSKTKK
ncbi:MarR family transcriptional regulator [Sporomusa malonica]|uniref:Flagellar operon protein TIGR03826 n=1 Tax=Sporomusa malonica TaxID=112901 RepID=A0A1W2ESS8_9FIRM|nr:MarR family transcriptional regulator [Sporomusa malonica]SMD12632.1 hypothetical protein SAMN04488500_1299 [Sporomusa malonica]